MVRTLIMALALGAVFVSAAAVELYSDKYDNIDCEAILRNDPLREQYYNCFMDTGPCVTDDAVFFKGNFPEAVVTKCAKCTARQQQMFEQLAEWYTANQEDKWNALINKFIEDAKKLKIAGA